MLCGGNAPKVMERAIDFNTFGLQGLAGRAGKLVSRLTRMRLERWYSLLPADWFDNPEPFPDGTSRRGSKRTFMFPLRNSWVDVMEADGFRLEFKKNRAGGNPWGLRLQQYGTEGLPSGAIVPVKKKALTLPVTQEAHGRSVHEFEVATGKKLFKVGKKEGHKLGTLAWEDEESGELHAAYVLRTRSVIKPLKERRGHDAIPQEEEIKTWAVESFIKFIESWQTQK